MRNLKRALSLTLASVMLLGMMVVGSSAAAGYDDVAETDNVEAIEVLQTVEVMVGDERGFGPERPVNRAEMAVVMGKLLNLDYNYYEATCPFNDVYDWARGWVGACYANGIVSGRGEGVYDPGTTVTAVEAASMLMRALGYFKYQSDYASGFEVATVLQANKIRLFDGVNSSTNEPLTRNQVAQMALNALKSGMVEPDGNALNFIDSNGNVIATGGKVNYVYVTSTKTFASAISRTTATSIGSSNDGWIVELGEQLYDGKLKLSDTTDAFGRPSRYWEYDAKAIGTYVKEELIRETYTAKVTGRTLYDLLGSTTIKDYDLDVYIDGVDDPAINEDVFDARHLVRTYDVGVGKTGNGVLTQVFVDQDKKLITIAVINTYLALADEDYDDRTDNVDITVYGIQEAGSTGEFVKNAKNDDGTSQNQSEGFTLEVEDFPSIVDVKDGDSFLVTVAQGEVQTIAAPEVLSAAQITSFKVGSWIVTGGTQYDFASTAEYECETLYDWTAKDNAVVNLKEIDYDVYLDKYGYAIGVKEVERVNNYVFITGVDTNANNRYTVQADATGIFLDGTMESMKIDMRAVRDLKDSGATYSALTNGTKGGSLVNKWFTYTVGNDGVYSVSVVGDSAKIDNDKARAGQYRTLNKLDGNIGTAPAFDALGTASHGVDTVEGPKSIALRGTYEPNSKWYSVYGDDQSVYITVELTTIPDATNKDIVNVISGVDNVAVGIDNANIEVYTEAKAKSQDLGTAVYTAYGTYTLFDKDGDVIAAVIVGEDAGATTNLVYTHKGMNSETDNNAGDARANASKGTYTWTRYVVANGEETLLTEVGSGLSELKSMKENTWYVVKYNAKGEVKNVYPAWDTAPSFKGLIDADAKDLLTDPARLEDRYVNNIEELNQATNKNTTVLYEVGGFNNTTDLRVGNISRMFGTDMKPSVDNHTFYVKTETSAGLHQGFRVSDDVKTVFIQTNNGEPSTIFESGYSRLEKLVNRLHDRDEKAGTVGYNYEISAVMENGKAVVVVIRDMNYVGAVIGKPTGKYEVRFQPGFWSDERNVFYVGVDKLSSDDFYNVNNKYDAFRVSSDTNDVQVVRKNATDEAFGDAYDTLVIGVYDNFAELGYVIGYVDRSGRVLSFTVHGDCTLYDFKQIWEAVATITPDTTDPNGFTPDNAGIAQNLESSVYSMWIRDSAHLTGPLPKSVGEPATEFVKGNTYTVTVEVEGKARTIENVKCETDGFLLVNIALTKADLIAAKDKNNIDVVLTSVVEGEGSAEVTEYQVTVAEGVTVTYKEDGKPVTTGKVAKDTIIVVEPSEDATKVVKVNGDPVTEKTEFTVDKAITITLEEVDKDEITVSASTEDESVEVEVAPATVSRKDGGKVTLTVTGAPENATIKYSVDGAEAVTMEGTSVEIEIAPVEDETKTEIKIVVTVEAEEESTDFTVTITGEAPSMVFTLKYTGEKPTDEAKILAKINEALKAADSDLVATQIAPNGTDVYAGKDQIGTIGEEGTFALYVNGTKVPNVELKTTASGAQDPIDVTAYLTDAKAACLVEKDTMASAVANGYTISGEIKKTIDIDAATRQGLTEDLYLVNAYTYAAADSGISGQATYTLPDGKTTGTAAANNVFPSGTVFVFTGTGTKNASTGTLTFTLGSYTDEKPAGDEALKWTVTFDPKTMLNADNAIKGKETGSIVTVLKIGNESWNIKAALTGTETITWEAGGPALPKAGKYVNVTTPTGYCDADDVVTIAVSGNNATVTFGGTPAPATPKDGVIELKPAFSFTAKADLAAVIFGTADEVTASENDEFYVVEDAASVQFMFDTQVVGDKAVVKSGTTELFSEAATAAGTVFTYDLTEATAAQKTAGLVLERVQPVATFELKHPGTKAADDTTKGAILGTPTGVSVSNSTIEAGTEANTLVITVKADDGYYFDKALELTIEADSGLTSGDFKITGATTKLVNGNLVVTVTHEATAQA